MLRSSEISYDRERHKSLSSEEGKVFIDKTALDEEAAETMAAKMQERVKAEGAKDYSEAANEIELETNAEFIREQISALKSLVAYEPSSEKAPLGVFTQSNSDSIAYIQDFIGRFQGKQDYAESVEGMRKDLGNKEKFQNTLLILRGSFGEFDTIKNIIIRLQTRLERLETQNHSPLSQ